jgi:hypothetical protein
MAGLIPGWLVWMYFHAGQWWSSSHVLEKYATGGSYQKLLLMIRAFTFIEKPNSNQAFHAREKGVIISIRFNNSLLFVKISILQKE